MDQILLNTNFKDYLLEDQVSIPWRNFLCYYAEDSWRPHNLLLGGYWEYTARSFHPSRMREAIRTQGISEAQKQLHF
jgi:hypothetical protein